MICLWLVEITAGVPSSIAAMKNKQFVNDGEPRELTVELKCLAPWTIQLAVRLLMRQSYWQPNWAAAMMGNGSQVHNYIGTCNDAGSAQHIANMPTAT